MAPRAAPSASPHPTHGTEIADIRVGTGYADLSSDLKRLAALYGQPDVAPVVQKDPVFYDAQDAPRARALAQSINEQLEAARTTEERRLTRDVARAWTLLGRAWDQIRRGVTFLAWSEPDVVAQFPPLYTLGRSAPGTAKAAAGASNGKPPKGGAADGATGDQG